NHPTLLNRYHVAPDDWLWSQAEYDYHAITYYADFQVLTLPLSCGRLVTFPDGTQQWIERSDQLVLHVDADRGTLDLAGEVRDSSPISRGVFIRDMLYSISATSVQVHALDDLNSLVAQVELPGPGYSNGWRWGWIVRPIIPIFVIDVHVPRDAHELAKGDGSEPATPAPDAKPPTAETETLPSPTT